jgi:hypothetical protein
MIHTSSNLEILFEIEKTYYFLQIYLILKVDIQILFCILYYLVFILKNIVIITLLTMAIATTTTTR